MAEDAVTFGYIHDGKRTSYSWHKSFVEMLGYDMTHGGHMIRGGWAAVRWSHNVVDSRNQAIRDWLDDPKYAEVDWWLWMDTDMGFRPDTLERLLSVADPVERPIIGALCFTAAEEHSDGLDGWTIEPRPTMFKWFPELGTVGIADYAVNSLVPVAATGAACILIHRTVFQKMRDELGDTWYNRIPNPFVGGMHGEDISFCLRAASVGFPTFVHTGVRTSHMKTIWIGEDFYWSYRSAPPAKHRTTVIVPVLNRPQNAEPFMESLRASTGMAEVLAVCSEDADADAWEKVGAGVLRVDEEGFAPKINAGTKASDTPFIFLTGDDVRFHPAWLDHAQHVADLHHVDVVGTNDLGNPRVMAGEHGTHLLIRRCYIEEHGASWDGPGVVCHEGYHHWYIDDEIVTVAKQRNTWASALGSYVEHAHPAWGKGNDDETYRKGQSRAQTDRRHFRSRLEKYGPK